VSEMDALDEFFARQSVRVMSTLAHVEDRIEQRRKDALRRSLADADVAERLAQIATNAGRVTLPGLDVYDSALSGPPSRGIGQVWPVDRMIAYGRKHTVGWGRADAKRRRCGVSTPMSGQ
jgi:hypothetical protein